MRVFGCIAIVACIFNVAVLLSADQDNAIQEDISWSYGKQKDCGGETCIDLFVGVYDILAVRGKTGTETSLRFDDESCTDDFCDKCRDTNESVITLSSICFFLIMASVVVCFMRASGSNNPRMKWIGILTSLGAVGTSVIALIAFAEGCQQHIYDTLSDTYTWEYGPAWIMLIIVGILMTVVTIGNVLVRPGYGNRDEELLGV